MSSNKSVTRVKSFAGRLTRKVSLYRGSSVAVPKGPVLRYQPTYRLEPMKKFNRDICELIMNKVVNVTLEDFKYTPKNAQILSRHISEEIQTRIQLQNYDRYKLVCVVTIGENYHQSGQACVRFLWDTNFDRHVNVVYQTSNFFCIATLYAIYYD